MISHFNLLNVPETEPIIPHDSYESFIAAISADEDLNETLVIETLQKLVSGLPPISRQLLLYILDLLAVLASKSEDNLMTSERLVAAFQPSLLSRSLSAMTAGDHTQAAKTMVFMVQYQDYFLVGMRGSAVDEEKAIAEKDEMPARENEITVEEEDITVTEGPATAEEGRSTVDMKHTVATTKR